MRTPYTDSVCYRAHSWRTKGTVSQACCMVCQTSCNISRYLVSPPARPEGEDSLHRQCVPPGSQLENQRYSLSSLFYCMSNILQYISLPCLPPCQTNPLPLPSPDVVCNELWWTRLCRRFVERTATRSRHMDMFSLETAGVTVTTRRAGRGALQGAQVQDGHILQVGRALPHQAPQH